MDFTIYKRLKKLVLRAKTFEEFIGQAATWPRRYAVVTPKIWSKADYFWFYGQIKGGQKYVTLFAAKA